MTCSEWDDYINSFFSLFSLLMLALSRSLILIAEKKYDAEWQAFTKDEIKPIFIPVCTPENIIP